MTSNGNGGVPLTFSVSERPEFMALFNDEVNALSAIFKKHNFPIKLAGGPVRDILSGKVPSDLDFATTATPDQMKAIFDEEGVRMINANGEEHGTITARINDRENYEITTLRIDKVTDGRRAEVEFTEDWRLDSNRRDLTVNSMFLDLEGTVTDYFRGSEDLEKKRVAFVGSAVERIQEDYLRILRYFRFYGRIAEDPDAHEAATIEAIKENVSGMKDISGERIWMEWKKILSGRFAGDITLKMIEVGLGPHIGLPETPDTEEMKRIWQSCSEKNLHPVTLLVSLLRNDQEMAKLHSRLKLSGFERDLGYFVIAQRVDKLHPNPIRPYQFLIIDSKAKTTDVRQWTVEVLKYKGLDELAQEIEEWEIPKFPVNGYDLISEGCPKGRLMSVVTQELKTIWKEKDFAISREDLLKELPKILDNIDMSAYEQKKQRKPKK